MVCSNGNNVLSGLNLCQSLHLHGCIELYYQTYLKHISQKRERANSIPQNWLTVVFWLDCLVYHLIFLVQATFNHTAVQCFFIQSIEHISAFTHQRMGAILASVSSPKTHQHIDQKCKWSNHRLSYRWMNALSPEPPPYQLITYFLFHFYLLQLGLWWKDNYSAPLCFDYKAFIYKKLEDCAFKH